VQRTEPLRRLDPHTHEYQLGEKRAGVQNKLLLNLRAKATITLILGLRRSKQSGRVPLKKHKLLRKFAMPAIFSQIFTKINANPLGLRKSNHIYCGPVYKTNITWTREQPRSSGPQGSKLAVGRKKREHNQNLSRRHARI